MKFLLLGAGASKAYSDSPTKMKMPIAKDFFSTFKNLDISSNPWVLIDALMDFIINVKGQDPIDFFSKDVDIEQLYTEIEENLNLYIGRDANFDRIRAFKSYTQLIFIFAATINSIQNGPVSRPHSSLAQKLSQHDIVATFNWDTLIDRALKNDTEWNTDIGYGFRPKSIYRNEWKTPNIVESKAPQLIKLHGSINWLSSHPISPEEAVILTQESASDTVWIYESTNNPYPCFAGRYAEGYQDFSYGYYPPNILDDRGKMVDDGHVLIRTRIKSPLMPKGTSSDEGLVSIPLIIPPVKAKNYHGYGALFDNLWRSAQKGIEEAKHIIIIGYSFPRTDLKSNQLFIDAFMNRKDIPFVTILDPQPERIADKFQFELGIPDSHLRVFKGYFSDDTNIDELLNFIK
ncbi:SIR2 family protein [Providencia sp. PROV153]|uniref:SIR2 family protein n=1 Tax=Providencia sp. PROV153 TaxID=2949863 RepID=UPI00234B55FB|nr:SIR2 family protein [Providencia sp. PROV153]